MDESNRDKAEAAASAGMDVTSIVRQAIEEFTQRDQAKNEPAYKAELQEERRRREQLERRLNAEDEFEPPEVPSSSNGHGNIEQAAVATT